MFTVCPKCALTLAVTAADLRAGQGYVRCGRCANVFNALLGLSEESAASATQNAPAAVEVEHPAPAAEAAAPATPSPAAPPSAAAPPASRLIESPPPPLPAVTGPPPEASEATEVEEFRGTGTFETIVLEGDTFLQTEEMVPEEAFDNQIAKVSRQLAAAQNAYRNDHADDHEDEVLDFSRSETAPAPEPALVATAPAPATATAPDTSDETAAQLVTTRAASGWRIVVGLCMLALLLGVQIIHHWRNDLATLRSLFNPLDRLYRAMGQPLAPNWNLAAYDVRQLGASSDDADHHRVHVRLSLSNHAPGPQMMPLVRLRLLDRYGKPLSAGEISPRQYLPAALQQTRWLDAEQRIDAELNVTDPTGQASSFELDVCVPTAGGGLRCGGDGAMLAANGIAP
ncbi:MAG: zinc-ribbon and DUF3426 domain-containing protein [Steroidobacteraceae bacterium]